MIRTKLFNSQVILGAKARGKHIIVHVQNESSSRQIIDNFIILLLVLSWFQGKISFFWCFLKCNLLFASHMQSLIIHFWFKMKWNDGQDGLGLETKFENFISRRQVIGRILGEANFFIKLHLIGKIHGTRQFLNIQTDVDI